MFDHRDDSTLRRRRTSTDMPSKTTMRKSRASIQRSPQKLIPASSTSDSILINEQTLPHFMQCVFLFGAMVLIIAAVVTLRGREVFSELPSIPSDYVPSYTASAAKIESHPSHIEDVHQLIDNLEIHKIDDVSAGDPKSANSANLKCGDVEATRKIFESLKVIEDKSKIHIWPLPQQYTIFEDVVSINVLSFQYESNVDHPVITKGIERYRSIMFPHQSRRQFADNGNTINKV